MMSDINQELAADIQLAIEEYDGKDCGISIAKLNGDPRDLRVLPPSLAKVKQLWEVTLNNAAVEDVSLLGQLTYMRELYLNAIPATDLSALASLTRLEMLMLRGVQITDLSFISGMKSLKFLDISGARVTDFTPLASCKKLVQLTLNNTAISDLAPLSAMTQLKCLNLDGTEIKSLEPLAGLKSLAELSLSRTKVHDLSPLSGLSKMARLRVDQTGVSDLSPLRDAAKLKDLSANHWPISDLAPLKGLTKLSCVYLGATKVRDIAAIADNKLRDLYLDGSELADLMPIKGNRSIPRIEIRTTGLAFRDTPIARQDPDGFGAIAQMDSAYPRSDALYRYFRKIKTWPLKKPLPTPTLAPVPDAPKQAGWPHLKRIKEDLLELESPPITDEGLYEMYFEPLVALAEDVREAARSFKRGERDDLFWLSHNFANRFASREKKKLNWRVVEDIGYACRERLKTRSEKAETRTRPSCRRHLRSWHFSARLQAETHRPTV